MSNTDPNASRPRHRPIPHRWCYTHGIPLWLSDTHYGLSAEPCDTSRILREVDEIEEGKVGRLKL